MNRKRINAAINIVGLVIWLAIIPLSIYFGWIYSVAFISFASIYANMVSHWAAWRADDDPELDAQIEEILELLKGEKDAD
jgi:hypothetical protein